MPTLLTRDRIKLRMPGEAGFESAAEIGPPDALQLVVKLDRYTTRLDDSAQLSAYVHEVGIDVAVSLTLSRPRDRLTAQDLGGVPINDEATAEPFRLAVAQPQAMRHAGAREPMMAHQAHQVRFIDRIGADPEKAIGQFLRDTADHL
jgi:hypothetical protein